MKGRFRSWPLLGILPLGLFLFLVGCDPEKPEAAETEESEKVAEVAEGDDPAIEPPEEEEDPAPENEKTPEEEMPLAEGEEEEPKSEPRPAPSLSELWKKKDLEPPTDPWSAAKGGGFAAHLPPDVDLYFDIRNLDWVWKLLKRFKIEESLMEGLEFPEEFAPFADKAREHLPKLVKEEMFVAVRGLEVPSGALVEVNQEMNRSMFRELTKLLVSGEFDLFDVEDFGTSFTEELSNWLTRNLEKTLEKKELAVYLGGKVEGGGKPAVEVFEEIFGFAAAEVEFLKQVAWDANGASWTGLELVLAEMPELQDAEPPGDMDEELWQELQERLHAVKLVVACAEVDDYVVLSFGLGKEALLLEEDPAESLAAQEQFEFLQKFEADSVYGLSWIGGTIIDDFVKWNRGQPAFEGIEQGLQDSPRLSAREGMVEAIREFNATWKKRGQGTAHDHLAALLVDDTDIRIESRGGWHGAALDLTTPLKFARLFDKMENVPFLRAHWKGKTEHIVQGRKQWGALFRFLKLMAGEIMDRTIEDADEEEIEKYEEWKLDLMRGIEDFGTGYAKHFSEALGDETAFVMDLRGEMIPAMGLDEDLVKKGRIPRAAYLRPVVNRDGLSETWNVWNRAATSLFGIVADAMDQPIPFPDTMTAEKNDLRTYFFTFPFASDDFLPSVSVSDELFILGTSKTLSESLYAASLDAAGGERPEGLWVDVNLDEFWDFSDQWLLLFEERDRRETGEFDGEIPDDVQGEARKELERLKKETLELREQQEELDQDLLDLLEVEPQEEEKSDEDESGVQLRWKREGVRTVQQDPPPAEIQPGVELEIPIPGIPELPNPLLEEFGPEEVDPLEMLQQAAVEVDLHDADFDELDLDKLERLQEEMGELDEFDFNPGPNPFDSLLENLPGYPEMREMLEKARAFRGIRYRRWLEDGVPRASLRLRWDREN